MSKKVVFITGANGMDASHLIDFLLEKDYKIYGLVRRNSANGLWRIQHVLDRIELVQGDMLDAGSLAKAIHLIKPDEIYALAAQSFVKHSFEAPVYTADATGLGTLRLIEAVRENHKKAKIFQASSSEMFGKIQETPQKETTKFYPRSPYGCAKCFAHYACVNYREAYNMFISCGISFNHESERRGEEFVSRKITKAVAKMQIEMRNFGQIRSKLELGNLDAKRDFGYAPSYVKGFWETLQQDKPEDYIFATGVTNSIENFVEVAFKIIGVADWKKYVVFNDNHIRPSEVDVLCGDATKAREKLGWEPEVGFEQMIKLMIQADL